MNTAEMLHLASQVLIVIGTFILYRTGNHIVRVWSEMRAELVEFRRAIMKPTNNEEPHEQQ